MLHCRFIYHKEQLSAGTAILSDLWASVEDSMWTIISARRMKQAARTTRLLKTRISAALSCRHKRAPCAGPSEKISLCGARKARYFSPKEKNKLGMLRYAFCVSQGVIPPLGGITQNRTTAKCEILLEENTKCAKKRLPSHRLRSHSYADGLIPKHLGFASKIIIPGGGYYVK